MGTAVQIELKVDEKGAVSGVRSFDSAVRNTTTNVKQLNTALAETNAQVAGSSLKTLEREFTGGESSLRTMNAEIRSLQGSIYGDTRATAEFLALWPKVGEAMELAFPLFGAIALVGVLAQAGEKIHELYDKYVSVTSAARDYNAEIQKAKEADFTDTHSIETTTERIKEATQAVEDYKKQVQSVYHNTLGDYISGNFLRKDIQAHPVLDKEYTTRRQIDKLHATGAEQKHREILDAIELSYAGDARLRGEQKITAEKNKQHAIDQENAKYAYQQDIAKGNSGAAASSEQKTKDAIADARADADLYNLRRDQAHELMQLHSQATNARLRGSALYEAQEKQAIEELRFADMDSVAARAAVHEKFHAEEMRRLEAEQEQIAKRARQAGGAGLSGIAKIQYEGETRQQDILADVRAGKYSTLQDAQQDQVSAERETLAQMKQAQQSFASDVDSIAERSVSRQVQGFARIRAEGSQQLDALQKKFDAMWKGVDLSKPGVATLHQLDSDALARGKAAINAGTRDQENELARRNAEETEQIEEQARIRSLNGEKQKTAAIAEEYRQRTRKYLDELNAREIGWDDYSARIKAAQEERDAEMEEAAKQAREKMASEFDSFFRGMNHPLQELALLGEKEAGKAAAELVQRVQQHGAGAGGHGGFLGGIFGRKYAGADLAAEMGGTHSTAASSIFSVGSATIHVGAAQIAFGGMTSAGSGSGKLLSAGNTISFGRGFAGVSSTSESVTGGFGARTGFGAGGSGAGTTPEAPAHISGGVMPSSGSSGANGVIGDLSGGLSLSNQSKGTFGNAGKSSGLETTSPTLSELIPNADGSTSSTAAAGSASGFLSKAGGAAGGALGLFSAFEGNGGVGGALSGAMSGMKLGAEFGGPIGAGIGAAAGAIIGAIGFGGREKAHVYDLKQVRPRITSDQDSYAQGGMDYLTAYSDMQSLDMEAKKATNKMGPAAESYYQDTIKKEIERAEQQFTREQKAGRSMYTVSAAMYDVGSDSVPRTGLAVIHAKERIFPSDQNERITSSIEAAAGITRIHRSYQAAMQTAGVSRSGATGETHLHFHAHDSKTAMQFLMANKHVIRSAVNASYAENSGGSDA